MTTALRAFIDAQERLPDDGRVDPVAVDRLLDGTLHWTRTTPAERLEAARRAQGRATFWDFATHTLGLNGSTVRALQAEST